MAQVKDPPRSCDTFVILPKVACDLPVCFGKNSDRPSDEEHEVVYVPHSEHPDGAQVRCTYIEIPQVLETLAVILSKPRWLWGCEMGANECGVVGGNEAVGTCAESELGTERRLLGMDLLRLALERGRSAREAMEVCAALLEAHGQGGGCAEDDESWTYENGFLFADASEAFILETAGAHWWAAERVEPGSFRNISNGLSIRTQIYRVHSGLKEHCQKLGWWNGAEPFDFKAVLTGRDAHEELPPVGRERFGHEFLRAIAGDVQKGALQSGKALAQRMMNILRDERSGICFRSLHGFNSTGSQVSLLPPIPGPGAEPGGCSDGGAEHFFTCASDPKVAAYKRFSFAEASNPQVEAIGPRSLELWRLHRKRAIARKAPLDLSAVEAVALGNTSVEDPPQTLAGLLEEELRLFA